MGLGVVTDWFWESLFCLLKICIKCYFGRSYKVNSILFIPVLGNLLIISLLRKEMQGLFSVCSWQQEFGQGIWKSFSLQLRRFVMWGWCLTEIQDVPKELLYVEFVDVSSVPLAIGLTGQRVLGVPIIVQASQVTSYLRIRALIVLETCLEPYKITSYYLELDVLRTALKTKADSFDIFVFSKFSSSVLI